MKEFRYRPVSPEKLKAMALAKERANRPVLTIDDPIIELLKRVVHIVEIRDNSFDPVTRVYAKNYQRSAEEAMPGSHRDLVTIAKIMAMSDYSTMSDSIEHFLKNID